MISRAGVTIDGYVSDQIAMSYIRYPTLKELRRYTRPPEGRYRLVTLVGEEVLAQIKQEFLSMEPVPLARLFKEYEMRHGRAAANYAVKSYPEWRAGYKGLSGQTEVRLFDLVPKYLSTAKRASLLSLIVANYHPERNRHYETVFLNLSEPEVCFRNIDRMNDIIRDGPKKIQEVELMDLPQNLINAASWLTANDMQAAKQILNDVFKARAIKVYNAGIETYEEFREVFANDKIQSGKVEVDLFYTVLTIHFDKTPPRKTVAERVDDIKERVKSRIDWPAIILLAVILLVFFTK